MNIFVTDGSQRSALAVVRSLGKKGHRVFVGEVEACSLAAASKYAFMGCSYASPERNPDSFIDDLAELAQKYSIDCVIPMTDITTYEITRNKSRFPASIAIAAAEFELYKLVHDKIHVFKLAERLGVPIPMTWYVADDVQLQQCIDGLTDYPYVVKPSSSRILRDGRWQKTSVRYIHCEDELLSLKNEGFAYPFMVQKKVTGPGVGFFVLLMKGEIISMFAHERIREKPPSGGVSVLRKSIFPEDVLKRHSLALLQALKWDGVAMVEFKKSAQDGTYYLMEINGRFWGSLQLAIDAGVDFPNAYVESISSKEITPCTEYRESVYSRWILGDTDHMLACLTKSREKLNLEKLTWQDRLRIVLSFLKDFNPRVKCEVMRFSDLRPFLRELKQYVIALGH